jgi:hypothetical protein
MSLEDGISLANASSLDFHVFLVCILLRLVQILLYPLQNRHERTKECSRLCIRLLGSFGGVEGLHFRPDKPDTLYNITGKPAEDWCNHLYQRGFAIYVLNTDLKIFVKVEKAISDRGGQYLGKGVIKPRTGSKQGAELRIQVISEKKRSTS